jgi:dihydroxyacetone kinase
MGLSLSAGIVPSVGKPSYSLSEQEVELGLGIHGEPGVEKVALGPADELVDKILSRITEAKVLHPGDRAILLINNLGATTPMELAVVARRSLRQLRSHGLMIERVYSGVFMSSLDTAGISLSLLRVDDERLRLLDAPTLAPGWPAVPPVRGGPAEARTIATHALESGGVPTPEVRTPAGKLFRNAATAACEALFAAENRLTMLDQAVGDGDLGVSFVRGASAIKDSLAEFTFDSPAVALKEIALKLQDHMGGSSGPLYGTLLIRAANSLTGTEINAGSWAVALEAGCDAVTEVGGANLGDRTMLDALLPFAKTLKALFEKSGADTDARAALEAAEQGAEATAQMMPKRGRSSYLGSRALGHPDPGAVAAVVWLRAIVDTVTETKSSPR